MYDQRYSGFSYKQQESSSDELTNQIQNLIKVKNQPLKCSTCNGTRLKYTGLGQYECSKCNNITYNNYGKAREVLDNYGPLSVQELMDKSDLSREDIQQLMNEGSLILSSGGLKSCFL